ncbi:MAG: methionine--tRNA ligase [Candidatus Woesearchaeota archaeon]
MNTINNTYKKILVTSALPYVNNVPHLGNLMCVISADVYTRFLRLMHKDVISILGTDEHGTTAETKALEEGLTPKQLCDKYYAIHTEIYNWFNCEFDCYGRTSSSDNSEVTINIFNKLYENGYIIEDTLEQLYCESCQRFLADRFVEGECPKCHYHDARGDQCDSCSNLLNANELINPKCKVCKSSPVIKETKHLFMDLPKIEPLLKEWMDTVQNAWSDNARTMTQAWLRDGLRQRCITRDLKWGIKVPLKDYNTKVFYSWFDAPIGYIGITKENRDDWKEWWHNDSNVKLVQFMGKDNIPFHTILFPAFCIGAKDNYTLMKEISVNEFLNYENAQFSKSRNTGVFGDDAKNTGIPADVFRYYLMINRPEKTDTEFSWNDFQIKNNSEIVGNFGNLVNRTVVFLNRNYDSVIPEAILEEKDHAVLDDIRLRIKKIENLIETIDIKEALKEIMLVSKLGNQYLQDNEPWKNPDKVRNATTLSVLANIVKDVAILISPYMPKASKSIQDQLNISKLDWNDLGKLTLHPGHKISNAQLLFKKIEDKEVIEFREQFSGKRSKASENKVVETKKSNNTKLSSDSKNSNATNITFDNVQLRVAKITSVERHPNAEKLYIEKLDFGDEYRQIVSGLVPYYSSEELLNKKIIVVTNLEPATIRGVESNGMLLAAEENGVVGLLQTNSEIGEYVYINNLDSKKLEHIKNLAQISIKEFSKLKIYAKDKIIYCNNDVLCTVDGELSVEKICNGPVR